MSASDVATVIAAGAAVIALGFSAYANVQTARSQSVENVFGFLDRCNEHTRALGDAADEEQRQRELGRTLNFFEAVCHGVVHKFYPRAARRAIRDNMINYLAALEISGAISSFHIPTSDTYSSIASFLKTNRKAINRSKAQQTASILSNGGL